MIYNKNLFEQAFNVLIADELETGMIICLSKNRYFYIEDLEKEFINDDVADLYPEYNKNVLPEHTKITLYDERENFISHIPGNIYVNAFKKIVGTHNLTTLK